MLVVLLYSTFTGIVLPFVFVMNWRTPGPTRTDPPFPYSSPFRSAAQRRPRHPPFQRLPLPLSWAAEKMARFRRIFFVAALADLLAGLFVTALHQEIGRAHV